MAILASPPAEVLEASTTDGDMPVTLDAQRSTADSGLGRSVHGTGIDRRAFIERSVGGLGGLVLGSLAACNDDPVDPAAQATIDLRTDDGRLNGLYALLQLKGEVFHRAVSSPFVGMPRDVLDLFTDVRSHTTAHIGYFVERLGPRRIYDLVEFELGGIDFSNATAVFGICRDVAETVSAACSGALLELRDADAARVIEKMASVHARHVAVLALLEDPTGAAFAGSDVADPGTGLDRMVSLADALEHVRGHFRTRLEIRS